MLYNEHFIHYYFKFFFTTTVTTEFYTLSLHDALPILLTSLLTYNTGSGVGATSAAPTSGATSRRTALSRHRSEEHTSELQSPDQLVCRLLLEKKKIF